MTSMRLQTKPPPPEAGSGAWCAWATKNLVLLDYPEYESNPDGVIAFLLKVIGDVVPEQHHVAVKAHVNLIKNIQLSKPKEKPLIRDKAKEELKATKELGKVERKKQAPLKLGLPRK